ncbi:M20/M25/M40 family metallo-hydrolase [Paenibacillus sp. TAB 01]|uniref:M20/M25/M40 family metallo-hydrolase n=1 Tax=Paenibacillus sp. TAB 01 TaxID=3368988 RepID=UPI00375265F0
MAQLFEAARRIAKDSLQFELAESATGGASDANFTAPIAPTLDGLGAVGDGAHARHEHVIIHEMPVRSALVALLIEQFSEPDVKLLQRKEEVH